MKQKGNALMNEFYLDDLGIRLHCKLDRPAEEPSPLCIVIHGLTGHMEEPHIVGVARAMNEVGIATLRAELYGHGLSGGAFEDHDMDKWLHNLETVLAYVDTLDFVTDLYLCGHSQGGLATILFAGRHPDRFTAILPLAPAIIIPKLAKRFAFEDLPSRMPFHDQYVGASYLRSAWNLDVDAAIDAYKGPVLLVQGTADQTVDPEDTVSAADRYTNATLAPIDGDSHCFDYHLDEVLETIKKYLSDR